ncbi:MAG TPA: hypothetical protein VMR31_09390 [Myxococcota bacterium]|nr:hypothetical protein [Myxococcota bacterium]
MRARSLAVLAVPLLSCAQPRTGSVEVPKRREGPVLYERAAIDKADVAPACAAASASALGS